MRSSSEEGVVLAAAAGVDAVGAAPGSADLVVELHRSDESSPMLYRGSRHRHGNTRIRFN